MEDIAYQDDEILQINYVIEVEQITSFCDTMVEGQKVDQSILFLVNNMDEEHEEFGFEDNIKSNENNEDYKDTQFE